jgi:ribose-phosphate pyrophosphokinase
MKIFSGSSNQSLSDKIAKALKIKPGKIELSKFPNGECRVWVRDEVVGETCVVVQSFSQPANDFIIEFLLITDALYRAGAVKIVAVIPWMGYSPQDKVFRPGEPLSAKVVGSIISHAKVSRILTFDIHNDSIPGFFSKPLVQLSGDQLFCGAIKKIVDHKKAVVVSPDFGAIKRSRHFADKLDLDHVIIDKRRDRATGQITIDGISGSVKGFTCLIFDDFISTGQTAIMTAAKLKEWGAVKVVFSATHYFDIAGVSDKLQDSQLDTILISDTIAIRDRLKYPKIKVLSTANIIANNLKFWL